MTTTATPRRRMMRATMLAAAAIAGVGSLGTAVPADAAPAKYVAISYSPVDRTWGTGLNPLLDTAIAGSLSSCGDKGGHCQLLSWSKNGCVALAVSGQYYYGWHGATRAEAIQGALQRTGPGASFVDARCTF